MLPEIHEPNLTDLERQIAAYLEQQFSHRHYLALNRRWKGIAHEQAARVIVETVRLSVQAGREESGGE